MKLFACLLSLLLIHPMAHAQVARQFGSIEQKIQKAIDERTVPSMVVAVAKDGAIVFEKAFGWADIESKARATVRTSYQLASVSKPITATGLMVLNRKKAVDINGRAETYMAPLRFSAHDAVVDDVKLRHLLNHTSGLGTYFDIAYADERRPQDDFQTAFRKYGKLFFSPGTVSEYSNLGYGLIDYIIARQSRRSFARFMQEEVFGPLGMTHSFVHATRRKDVAIAKKYGSNNSPLPDVVNNTDGAGNIYSSVHDLIRFAMFHLKSDLRDQRQILRPEEIDLMQSHREPNVLYPYYESSAYGLGWYHKSDDNGYRVVWHEGGMMGASSIVRLIPESRVAIAVITNTSNRRLTNEIADELGKAVLPGYQPTSLGEDAEVADFKPFTTAPDFIGEWTGTIKFDQLEAPCSLQLLSNGTAIITYTDFTYRSYFTQDNPIPHKTILLSTIVNDEFLVATFPGTVPSKDVRREFSQILSLKLYRKGNSLAGTLVALAAASREYYAYPFYVRLEKKKEGGEPVGSSDHPKAMR